VDLTAPTYRLRFFFDAGGGICFWAGNDAARARYGYPIDTDSLPLSPDVTLLANALCERFDASVDWDNPAGPSPWSAAEWGRFGAETRAFLETVRGQLGPDFEVIDESTWVM
jgi:hypothetical protein